MLWRELGRETNLGAIPFTVALALLWQFHLRTKRNAIWNEIRNTSNFQFAQVPFRSFGFLKLPSAWWLVKGSKGQSQTGQFDSVSHSSTSYLTSRLLDELPPPQVSEQTAQVLHTSHEMREQLESRQSTVRSWLHWLVKIDMDSGISRLPRGRKHCDLASETLSTRSHESKPGLRSKRW